MKDVVYGLFASDLKALAEDQLDGHDASQLRVEDMFFGKRSSKVLNSFGSDPTGMIAKTYFL